MPILRCHNSLFPPSPNFPMTLVLNPPISPSPHLISPNLLISQSPIPKIQNISNIKIPHISQSPVKFSDPQSSIHLIPSSFKYPFLQYLNPQISRPPNPQSPLANTSISRSTILHYQILISKNIQTQKFQNTIIFLSPNSPIFIHQSPNPPIT